MSKRDLLPGRTIGQTCLPEKVATAGAGHEANVSGARSQTHRAGEAGLILIHVVAVVFHLVEISGATDVVHDAKSVIDVVGRHIPVSITRSAYQAFTAATRSAPRAGQTHGICRI